MPEPKRCPRCATVKPPAAFARNKGRSDGLQSYCRACRAEIDHRNYEREVGRSVTRRPRTSYETPRWRWLRDRKTDRPCTDCGRVFDPQVMQWDHLPQFEKLGDISSGFPGRSETEILREMVKCELVCTNCHIIRTFKRNGWDGRSLQETEATYGSAWMQIAA